MIEQAFITGFSLSSLAVAYWPGRDWRRWSCILGLAAQPFWVLHVFKTGAFGILPLTPAFCAIYGIAIHEHWIAPWKQGGADVP